MRPALTSLVVAMASVAFAQDTAVNPLKTGLPGQYQPEYFLSRAERLGWEEVVTERTPHSSTFQKGNFKTSYSSMAAVNFERNGELIPVDIRPHRIAEGWAAYQQPTPVMAFADGSFQIGGAEVGQLTFGEVLSVNGAVPTSWPIGREDALHVWFDHVVPGVSKQLVFGHGNLKYNYLIQQQPAISGQHWFVRERIILPPGAKAVNNDNKNNPNEPVLNVISPEGKILGQIHPVVSYDQNGAFSIGKLELISNKEGEAIIEIRVDAAWLNDPDRAYPVIVDPLVTGPTANWGGGNFPSCFFPEYYTEPFITVTVPAGITITKLGVTTSFYASPFTFAVMGEGRMFFTTTCGDSPIYQVAAGPEANQPGTVYMDDFNIMNPMTCCYPQSCTSYTFDYYMRLSRTSFGPGCNMNYIFYTTATQWPFSVYAEGYTPETYGPEMNFNPNNICANTCETNARVYARYGVPPYTMSHAWSSESVTAGTAAGCNQGNIFAVVPIQIPNCPNYCDPATSLAVPGPTAVDACGATVINYAATYNLTVRPVAELTPVDDEIIVCSEVPINPGWTTCLPNATINWGGNGTGGTDFSFNDTIPNFSGEPIYLTYTAFPTSNGCDGPTSDINVVVYPYASQDFSAEPNPVIVTNPIDLQDLGAYFGNNPIEWVWTHNGEVFSTEPTADISFNQPGDYEICLFVFTEHGCSGQVCKTVTVIPAELVLPNIFSPNGDGINDELIIQYIDFYAGNNLKVFNRWGQLVFEATDYKNDWKAEGLSDGVYYYLVTLPDGSEYNSALQIAR